MSDLTVEDTIVLWDCSRSMVRTDFKPSRLRIAQKLIKIFVDTKLSIDYKDSIAIAAYGSRTKRVSKFSTDPEYLKQSLSKFDVSGNSNIEDGLAFALQLLINQIQKLGGKTPRIMIFTDNSVNYRATERLKKLIKICQGLGVFVDVCQIGEPKKGKAETNVLKELAYTTNGEYAFFKNNQALFAGAAGFASKKTINESEDYFNPNKEKDNLAPYISQVSINLRRPTIDEIRGMIKGKIVNKCQICYQNICPTCRSQFYGCGRFCPSCNRPIHLHCASKWSEQSEFADKSVFRCPFCYFLLKVPPSVQKLMAMTGGKIKIIDEDISAPPVKMVLIPDEIVDDIDDACLFCNTIFDHERQTFQCSGCKAYYHENCLRKMDEKIGSCRSCGGKIQKK